MLLRGLLRNRFHKVYHSKQASQHLIDRSSKESKNQQYIVFPTKAPIFPYSKYALKVHRQFYTYLKQNSIEYIAACVLQPGAYRKKYIPTSQDDLIKQLCLKPTEKKDTAFQYNPLSVFNKGQFYDLIYDDNTRQQQAGVQYITHPNQIYPMASVCKIMSASEKDLLLILRSEIRLQLNIKQQDRTNNETKPFMYVSGETVSDRQTHTQISKTAQYTSLLQSYKFLNEHHKIFNAKGNLQTPLKFIQSLSEYLSTTVYFNRFQIYSLFSTVNLFERTKILAKYYKQYLSQLKNQVKAIQDSIQDSQDSKQIDQEIYEDLQNMLTSKSDRQFIKNVKTQLASGRYPDQVVKIVKSQLENLQEINDSNPQNNRKKNFINLIMAYPFGQYAQEIHDVANAKNILDEDHYGMKSVKQRILEFIAVSSLKGQFKSKVLLLYGPPGVGKTSIVQSIAKCLNRPYGRISLGGEYDPNLLKGHRKTYLGAYPGKIFDTISKSKVENPVILLDEIDKIQSRVNGASLQDVVMSVLDPIQNNKFKDQFMNIQIDLSKVLFICTANQLDTIFPPLLDRLERIEVSGYTTGEKKQIFRRYVIKKSMQNSGIPAQLMSQINFTDEALDSLIQGYCKESGIRSLVRKTNSIFNKLALRYVKNEQFDKQITTKTLRQYLGLPLFKESRLFENIPPKGVIIGLAYNSYGGSIMYIEAAVAYLKQTEKNMKIDSQNKQLPKGSLIVTGNLLDVMKQSCQLAYSYAKFVTSTYFDNNFLQVNDIHLNFPQIQIGKDGPSAGAAITCSLISLALNKPSTREIAMTGQITLSGRVTAIGGVKEKTMGAKREGITHLIFPEQNRRDIQQLEPQVKEGVTYYFVDHFDEVMDLVFGLKVNQKKNENEAKNVSV